MSTRAIDQYATLLRRNGIITPYKTYPVADLVAHIAAKLPPDTADRATKHVATSVGVTPVQVRRRIRDRRPLDEYEADRWALKCDTDPRDIWPHWGKPQGAGKS